MTLSFRLRSGTYKPMAAESTPPRPAKVIKCSIRLLDESQQVIELEKSAVGQNLLDRLFDTLDLAERDYFGLQLLDPHQEFPNVVRWIEVDKKIRKQFKNDGVYAFLFRVKFYAPDPCRLQEEYTRYHFFMQLKLDISEKRLWVTEEAAILLASYAVQSELGDFNPSEHRDGYAAEFRYFIAGLEPLPQMFEQRVMELHIQHRGQSPADAEFNFLYNARNLETYGVVLFDVISFPPFTYEDPTERPYSHENTVHLGVSASGLTIFRSGRRVFTYPWANICKVSFKRRQFLLSAVLENSSERQTANTKSRFGAANGVAAADNGREFMEHAAFTLANPKLARSLWQTAVEYHTFFRLKSPPTTNKSAALLAPFNVAFRYSGRTEFQGIEDMKRKMRTVERPFSRASFNRYARRTINSTMPMPLQIGSKPISTSSASSLCRANNSSKAAPVPLSSPTQNGNGTASNGSSWLGKSSFSFGIVNMTPSKVSNTQNNDATSPNGGPKASSSSVNAMSTIINGTHLEIDQNNVTCRKTVTQQLLGIPERIEDLPFYEEPQANSQSATAAAPSYQQRSFPTNNSNALSIRSSTASQMGSVNSSNSASANFSVPLVTIRLRPDTDGRFGFNVKGGRDQQMAVVVSRVAPNTPADRAIPRLREGDLLLSINGRDPNLMLHDEVVNAIRTSRDESTGDLVLVVRPQLQVPSLDLQGASSSSSVPRVSNVRSIEATGAVSTPPSYRSQKQTSQPVVDYLQRSIQEMRDALTAAGSQSLISRFEKLERRNSSMVVSVATYAENLPKNRYRDITPYDETRVKIKNKHNGDGDYINASHVNMEIPGAGVVNRYICCQGPLPHTCGDFWQMAWEQQSTLIVMLTAQMEQGMVKCHQYWPNPAESCVYENLQVTCIRETLIPSSASTASHVGISERQLSLINLLTNEERHVTQLQYMAWPDHGVPEDPRSFIDFVQRVRSLRAGTVEPTIVHCSAGIGRTGVILLVETAMSLIEARQPVDPVEIVRRLRCQRAMLVQNASQFVFACQAILKVFDEQIVAPSMS